MMVKEIKKVEAKHLVTKSNILIGSRYQLTLNEQKLMYCLISQLQPNQENFETITFDAKNLAEKCKMATTQINRDFSKITDTLMKRIVEIKKEDDKEGWFKAQWIIGAEFISATKSKKNVATISLTLNPILKPYLLHLKENFTSWQIEAFLKFTSQYSSRIYEIIMQYKTFGERTVSIQFLREILGIGKNQYTLTTNFKSKILETAVQDINNFSHYNLNYELIKNGKKFTEIKFTFKEKNSPKIITESDQFDNNSGEDIYLKLSSIGISKATVQSFKNKYVVERILKNFTLAMEQHILNPKNNLAGWIIYSIENNLAEQINEQTETEKEIKNLIKEHKNKKNILEFKSKKGDELEYEISSIVKTEERLAELQKKANEGSEFLKELLKDEKFINKMQEKITLENEGEI